MIMSTEEIKEGLAFTRKYIRKLAVVDEVTAQQLTAINKSQKDVIIYVLTFLITTKRIIATEEKG